MPSHLPALQKGYVYRTYFSVTDANLANLDAAYRVCKAYYHIPPFKPYLAGILKRKEVSCYLFSLETWIKEATGAKLKIGSGEHAYKDIYSAGNIIDSEPIGFVGFTLLSRGRQSGTYIKCQPLARTSMLCDVDAAQLLYEALFDYLSGLKPTPQGPVELVMSLSEDENRFARTIRDEFSDLSNVSVTDDITTEDRSADSFIRQNHRLAFSRFPEAPR